jgi:AcrR family transcriptional regulator
MAPARKTASKRAAPTKRTARQTPGAPSALATTRTGPQPKSATTRRAILDAAIARFGRDGYKATRVADIARDAGVGGTITYAYFPNKEALFLAALDEDTAGVIQHALAVAIAGPASPEWSKQVIPTLVAALDEHPLARRVLAGLEPHATDRLLEIPALAELRKVMAEQLRTGQLDGTVRNDIDPTSTANGINLLMLSFLMSTVQFGSEVSDTYRDDVLGVIAAAILPHA